jgi:hypothetical protein
LLLLALLFLVKLFVVLLFSWVFCEEEKESLPSEEEEAAKETPLFSRSPSFVLLVFVFATSFFFFETAGEDAQDVADDDDKRDSNDDDLSSSLCCEVRRMSRMSAFAFVEKKKNSLTGTSQKGENLKKKQTALCLLCVSFSKNSKQKSALSHSLQLCARVEKSNAKSSSYPFATVPNRARASIFCIDAISFPVFFWIAVNRARERNLIFKIQLGKCFTRLCRCPLEAGWSFDAALLLLLLPRCP